MIHLLAFQDLDVGIGHIIYSDGTITVSIELICPMISALNNFVSECTKDERGFVNASLEDIKIFLYAPEGETNPLRYVFFTDIYDDIEYLKFKAQNIHKYLSSYISFEFFSIPPEIEKKVFEIVTYSQTFPIEKLSSSFVALLNNKIKTLEENSTVVFADLFVGDIDQGVAYRFISREQLKEKKSSKLFSSIISTFGFTEDRLRVDSPLNKEEIKRLEKFGISNATRYHEGWIVKKLVDAKSDFWLVSYMYYELSALVEIEKTLNEITSLLSREITQYISKRPF